MTQTVKATSKVTKAAVICGAALCLEERLGGTIEFGEIFYHGNRRRQRVMFTEELRGLTEAAILGAQSAHERLMPGPIENTRKCQACSLKSICLPQEMRFLQAE